MLQKISAQNLRVYPFKRPLPSAEILSDDQDEVLEAIHNAVSQESKNCFYCFHKTKLGNIFIGFIDEKISFLALRADENEALKLLDKLWPRKNFSKVALNSYQPHLAFYLENFLNFRKLGSRDEQQELAQIFHRVLVDRQNHLKNKFSSIQEIYFDLKLKGSKLDLEVWKALTQIDPKQNYSYQDFADLMGKKTAVRAVASAIARNNIALLIPCHQIVLKSGKSGRYRWGEDLKRKLLFSREFG